MNILILSCGTRNKIVQYIKRELNGTGNVVATDMSPNAPALYEADKHYIVPRMTAPGYLDVIYDICKKEQITGVFSLIDPELSLLALHEQEFKNLGVTIIGSSYELCERTLDKWKMFQWLTAHGYDCAESYVDKEVFYKDVAAKKQNYPVFVKPANAGSSVGVSKAKNAAELDKAVAIAAKEDKKIVIEECIVGKEVECAVMGNAIPKVSVVGEIAPSAEFYDYEDKYKNGTSKVYIPAPLDDELSAEICNTAAKAYRALGCSGLSRVDFFVRDSDNAVLLNEINTLPGFTSISMYSMLWKACGIDYGHLLDHIIQFAFDK